VLVVLVLVAWPVSGRYRQTENKGVVRPNRRLPSYHVPHSEEPGSHPKITTSIWQYGNSMGHNALAFAQPTFLYRLLGRTSDQGHFTLLWPYGIPLCNTMVHVYHGTIVVHVYGSILDFKLFLR
jgi:hypothetical protein